MTKQILVIVDSVDVNDSSGSKANVALINNLSAIGYTVKVLHFTKKDIHLKDIECISVKEKKYNVLYFLSRAQRLLQRHFKINLAKYFEPIFGFSFTFFNDVNSIKSVLKKQDASKFDLVLTLSKGASFRSHYAVNQMPDLYRKWMAYIHDPYPMRCYPPPYNWNEPGYKLKQQFFKKLSERAKYAAFPSKLLNDWMGKHFPEFLKTGVIIPHQNFKIEKPSSNQINGFDGNKFNILHAGNLMKQRNPEGLIEGFKLFLERNPEAKNDARLLMLGNADYHKENIENQVVDLPQISLFLSNLPFREVYALQCQVSVNVILEAVSEISPFLPGKFPHCVKANKPILHLGPKLSETKRLLGEHYEFWSEANNANEIALAFEKFYKKWLLNPSAMQLNRPDLEDYLGQPFLKTQFSKVLKND